MNERDYNSLKLISGMFNYIARDKNQEDARVFVEKPTKDELSGIWISDNTSIEIEDGFDDRAVALFISWDETEPRSIHQLIEEFEVH